MDVASADDFATKRCAASPGIPIKKAEGGFGHRIFPWLSRGAVSLGEQSHR